MTNRRKPAESYTHTHTHTCSPLLRIKQIGTICFAISLLISAPLFATGIPSDVSTADCKNSTLSTYSGTSNLEANWDANIITLHWYSEDNEIQNVPSTSQSCTYDGSLEPLPVSNVPTRTGYTFKGWRARQAAGCSFASQVCGLNGSAVDGLTYNSSDSSTYGYNSHNGTNTQNTSTYGLTSTGTWAVKDTNNGVIKGIASCNSTGSNTYDTTMTEEQAWGSCSSDAIKPGNTFSNTSNLNNGDKYCWCKMTSYTPSGESACNVASPSWVFDRDLGSASNCANLCAVFCAIGVMNYGDDFLRALFGVAQ